MGVSVVERDAGAHHTILRFESLGTGLGCARHEEQMSTSPARDFHGRDAELALIRAELERLSDGTEAVVVVEGAAGMGKIRLLAEVSTVGRSLRIRDGTRAADPNETVVALSALLS